MANQPWLLPVFYSLSDASPEWSIALSTLVAHGFPVVFEKNPKAEGVWLFPGTEGFQEKEEKWLKKLPEDARKVFISKQPDEALLLKNTYVLTGHPARSLLLLAKALAMPVSPFLDHIPGLAFKNMLQKVTIQPDELSRDFPQLAAGFPGQNHHVAQWVTTGSTQSEWLPISPVPHATGVMIWVGEMPPPSYPHWHNWNPHGLKHLWWPQVKSATQADFVREAWPELQALGFHHLLATTSERILLPEAQWLTLPTLLFSTETSSTGFPPDALPWVVVASGKSAPQVLSHAWLFRALGGRGKKNYATAQLSARMARRFGPKKDKAHPWWKFWT